MRNLLIAFILLIGNYATYAQQVAKGITASNGQFIGFYEYKPTNYNPTATKKYPLIIFLHGIGERGNGTSDLAKVTYHAIPRMIAAGGTMTYKNPATGQLETFLVLSPQLSTSYGSWETFYVDEMLKYAKQNLNYDPSRVYLTGLSLGGGGTWKYAGASLTNAQQFAAIASVCPSCEYNPGTLESTIVAAKVGVWSFHAMDDNICSYVCTNYPIDIVNNLKPATPAKKTLYPTGGHYIWEIVYSNPEVFEWFLGQSRGSTPVSPNVLPVAKAGNDQTIDLSAKSVTLTNSGSYDSDGSVTAYKWTQVSGPSTAMLSAPFSASTVASSLVAGIYTFRLTVTDNAGGTGYDDVVITVNALAGTQLPVANAGKDVTLPLGQAHVLSGSASTATAGVKSYAWTKLSGPSQYEMLSPGSMDTWIRNMVNGTYLYRLTVTDNNGAISTDDVVVTVGASGTTTTTTSTAPVADAGKDESIPVGQATVLRGTSSTAAAGIRSYSWTKVSGPTQYEMLTPGASTTWIRNMVAGTYVFRLTITDNNGAVASDDVVITVGGGTTITTTTTSTSSAPVANAGKDETIPVGQATVLNAGASTAAAGIKSYLWTKVSGPAAYEMLTPSASSTWIRNMTAGTYVYRATITDNNGATSTDDVIITVTAPK